MRIAKAGPHRAEKKVAKKTAKKAVNKKSAKRASVREGNGLETFAMHANERAPKARTVVAALTTARMASRSPRPVAAAPVAMASLAPEAAARGYLEDALANKEPKAFVRPTMAESGRAEASVPSDFKSLGAEAIPLTRTTMVKFRQTFHKIPVYGSLVTVELTDKNQLVGISSALGTPHQVPHVAKVSPAAALAKAAKESGQAPRRIASTPTLYFFFHQGDSAWHLAYIIEDVPQAKRAVGKRGADSPKKDYVVDASSGKLLAALPRTPRISIDSTGTDGTGATRRMKVERVGASKVVMRNTQLNLTTYDFGFRDPAAQEHLLPGKLVAQPPQPWPPEAVGAHANAAVVAVFLRDVLKRNNIDNQGGEMRSSVNCWDKSEGEDPPREWKNAFWNGEQMVYGQIQFPNGSFYSIANMTDVVAHEMFHGVTDMTSRLEYQTQSGALNESYSDIFGVIVANAGKPLGRWTWQIGEGFDGPGTALRDLQDPTLHGQPKTMVNYRRSSPPYTFERNDYGHVHDNSGIHNFAAYKIMTAKNGTRYLFTADELAQVFYIALTAHLSRTSNFADSKRAVLQAAQSLFRSETEPRRTKRLRAIEAGFRAAGIV